MPVYLLQGPKVSGNAIVGIVPTQYRVKKELGIELLYLPPLFFQPEFDRTVVAIRQRKICQSENADEELAFPFSFHGITPNHPAIILKHIIQTICYGIMATNNVIWSCDVSSFQIKPN